MVSLNNRRIQQHIFGEEKHKLIAFYFSIKYSIYFPPLQQITWADLAVMNAWHWIPGFEVFPKIHKYPKLEAHRMRIEAHPRIKAWLETRPITPV